MKAGHALGGALALVLGVILLVVLIIVPASEEDCIPPGGRATSSDAGGGAVAPGTKVLPTDPSQTQVSSGYGDRAGSFHYGQDFAGPIGTPIYAAYDGQVVAAADSGVSGFGGWIVLQHTINGQQVQTTYGHMNPGQVLVTVGQTVHAGQHIADIGNSGQSTGPHLHFEVTPGASRQSSGGSGGIDPNPWLADAVPPAGRQLTPAPPTVTADPRQVAATASDPALAGGAPSGADVLIVGDGIVDGTRPALERALPGARVDARVGRPFAEGAQLLLEQRDRLPRTVVLALGTDSGVEEAAYRDLVTALQAAKPGIRIVGVTTFAGRPWTESTNKAIAAAPGVQVADWHSAAGGDAQLLTGDGVHPSRQGQDKFAGLIASAASGGAPATIQRAPAASGQTCTTPGGAMGGGGDLDLSKVPEAFREPFKMASGLCPGYPMSLVAAEMYNESGFLYPIEGIVTASGERAQGPAQFMPSTWSTRGKDWNGDGVADPQDPADAVPSMVTMLCEDYHTIQGWIADGKVSGDPADLAIAAYHAGISAVRAAGGMPSTTDGLSTTANYVANTRRLAKEYELSAGTRNPDQQVVFGEHSGPIGDNAARAALSHIGVPYVWGGTDPRTGLDCSGLTQLVVREASGGKIELPRTSEQQWGVGTEIPLSQARAGDLVFESFSGSGPGHVAVVVAPGQMVEAPQPGQNVSQVPIRSDMKARRVIQ